MATKLPERNTRVSIACTACRARKHRCSGEKPRCAQCISNDLPCEWPTQQKRGPPKQYIHSLEARLSQTENVLLALLAQVSAEQLDASFQQTPLSGNHDSGSLETPIELNVEGPSMTRKEVSYWKEFPLDSPENVRQWWQHKLSLMTGPSCGKHTGDEETTLIRENTIDMVPSTAPFLFHQARGESEPAFPFAQDTGPQSFELEASDTDIQDLPLEAENENEIQYTGGLGYDMDKAHETANPSATRAEGVMKLSEEFKQDYIW